MHLPHSERHPLRDDGMGGAGVRGGGEGDLCRAGEAILERRSGMGGIEEDVTSHSVRLDFKVFKF